MQRTRDQIIDEVVQLSGMKTWLGQLPWRMDQMLDGLIENSMAEKADVGMVRGSKTKYTDLTT